MEILDDNRMKKVSQIRYANFGHRFLAMLMDFLVMIIPIGISMYYGFVEKNFAVALIGAIVGGLYKPVMEGVYGATVGKMAVGIIMVDGNNDVTDLTQSFTKNGVYLINTAIGIVSQIWMFGVDEFMNNEDLMESIMAVQENPYQTISSIWSLAILISCFAMLASDKRQTLHDSLAGTYCVEKTSLPSEKWV